MDWQKNRPSKFRFIFGKASNKRLYYDNVKVTTNAWDSNLLKTNGKFISLTWKSTGGGAFAVIPIEEVGKFSDDVPLFRGHTAQVLDTDFDPFNDHRIASASDDGKVGIWEIPKRYSFGRYRSISGGGFKLSKNITPLKMLVGHSKRVGHVLYHPLAKDVLASSSFDNSIKIWRVDTGEDLITLLHPDLVTSMCFSFDGSYLVTVARDRMIRIWDIRAQKIISHSLGHESVKKQRVAWLGESNRLVTTGFSLIGDRQVAIWDGFQLEKGPLSGFYNIDFSSSILMPFFDDCNNILYLVGKGDGNIRYYEFRNDQLFELSEFFSTDSQRGFAVIPRRMVDIKHNEVFKGFKTVQDKRIEQVSFIIPRRSKEFQQDLYSDAPSDKPALNSSEWFSGKSVDGPILISMKSIFDDTEPIFRKFKKHTTEVPHDINGSETDVSEGSSSDESKPKTPTHQCIDKSTVSPLSNSTVVQSSDNTDNMSFDGPTDVEEEYENEIETMTINSSIINIDIDVAPTVPINMAIAGASTKRNIKDTIKHSSVKSNDRISQAKENIQTLLDLIERLDISVNELSKIQQTESSFERLKPYDRMIKKIDRLI
ncbi:hypothetical protein TBLA_0E04570 [Henningerozyma blattae CBS 6284]|uniref:Coronin n=1 Tax=Henningerozyma blattae (strain ATCC 34711 / CBS 6284 / DSM 70876 / NBRC 10599 / NRRL Y-10934 / UCD 77-7) TaxID=1071380 RepID=I2H557_HENB6|nr:hypothetical protein TBLA_0E04570 [Tetrapisispora blattae CBS 6284]CCH61509.1 hypothetical protein TBLA_0E04570 [Tetrapisispora blattae CBS 6284]